MSKYRVTLTFQARSIQDAAEIVCSPERLPREARMQIQDVDHRRTIRLALVLGVTIAFWLAVGTGLAHVWRILP